MMFGLALTTTAAYAYFDAGVLAEAEGPEYRNWAGRFALGLYTLGLIWFAAAGSWYVFVALPTDARAALMAGPGLIITILTAIAPGLPWILLLLRRNAPDRTGALMVGLAQFGVLVLNAISRQALQNIELAPFFEPAAAPVDVQWSPLILFLVLFAGGLVLIGWMVAQAARAVRKTEEPAPGT
jgi:hypothetical protein